MKAIEEMPNAIELTWLLKYMESKMKSKIKKVETMKESTNAFTVIVKNQKDTSSD